MKKFLAKILIVVMVFGTIFGSAARNNVYAKESNDYVIKVNKGTNCVTIYKNDKPIKAMICSPSSETPEGTFYTPIKYRWHEMIGNCYAQYCTRITGSVLFHSVWYYQNGNKSTMSVSAYNVMGQKASHGCVRLLCKDAKWIYDNCALKTKVVIFNGTSKDDPLGRPTFTPLATTSRTSWDPTDPDPANPFNKLKPTVVAKQKTIEYGSKVNNLDLVTIKDSAGNTLTKKTAKIKVSGKIRVKKLGTYKVKYTVTDSLGQKKVQTIKFKVVDTKRPNITGAASKRNIAMGSTQNLLSGVKANAVSGRNLTSRINIRVKNLSTGKYLKVAKGSVNFTNAAKYKIVYQVTGVNKKKRTKTITYSVNDQRVNMSVNTNITLKQGQTFNALSYVNSIKNYKGDVLNKNTCVKVSGTVNTKVPGTYTITYTGTDGKNSYTTRKVIAKIKVVKVEVPTTQPPTTQQPTTEQPTTEQTTTEQSTTGSGVETTTNMANQDNGWTGRY